MLFLCTYNILYGINKEVFNSLNILHTRIKNKPYVIALQEVRNVNEFGQIESKIREIFDRESITFNMYHKLDSNHLGLALISNLKLIESVNLRLPQLKRKPWYIQAYFLDQMPICGGIINTYEMGDGVLTVVTLHLDIAGGLDHKLVQVAEIKSHLDRKHKGKIVVMGDFNTNGILKSSKNKVERQIEDICAFFGPDYKVIGTTATHSSDIKNEVSPATPFYKLIAKLPKIGIYFKQRIDWILVKDLEVLEDGVYTDMLGSDHYPVWAVVT